MITISILQMKKLRPGKVSTLSTVTVSKLWNRISFQHDKIWHLKAHDKNRKEWRRTEDSDKKLGGTAFIKKINI